MILRTLFTLLLLTILLPSSWAQEEVIESTSKPRDKMAAESYKGEEVYKVVDHMPRFPGCEHFDHGHEGQSCATKKLLEFVYGNVKYPASDRENNIQGSTIVRFIVEKDGSITNIKMVRSLSSTIDDECMRIMNMMAKKKKWESGIQDGRPVRVEFTLPIKFKLENNIKRTKKGRSRK